MCLCVCATCECVWEFALRVCVCVYSVCLCVCAGIPQGCCLRHDFNFILASASQVCLPLPLPLYVCVCQSASLSHFSPFHCSYLCPSLCPLSLPSAAFRKLLICSVMWQHYLLDCFILRKRCLWFDTMHAHRHAHTHTQAHPCTHIQYTHI